MAETLKEKLKAILASRRFWVAVGTIAAVALKDHLPFTEEQIQQGVIIIASWIVGESFRSSEEK